MATSIQAKIAPLPRGDYSSSATYAKLDVVSYNGSSYMAIKAVPVGTAPTNTTYWQLLAATATIPDGSISTSKLADGAVTLAKLDSSVSDKYAEVSGTYEDMVVGSAEQLLSTQYDTDSVPYAFRKSPYGDREFDEIVGGSIAWNQLVQNGDYADGSTSWFGSKGSVSNGEATVTINGSWNNDIRQNLNTVANHVYFGMFKAKSASLSTQTVYFAQVNTSADAVFARSTALTTSYKTACGIGKTTVNGTAVRLALQENGSSLTNQTFNVDDVNLFDLTQMFGSTVADAIYAMEQSSSGSGVAFFRGLFPKPYYAYNAGELISVSGLSAHKMTGFNQFDVANAVDFHGYLGDTGNGKAWISSSDSRSIAIKCLPNIKYYVFCNGMTPSILRVGDISGDLPQPTSSWGQILLNKDYETSTYGEVSYTTSAKANWLVIQSNSNTFNNFKNSLCVNLSGDGSRNGEYEPYESHSYSLDSSLTLRGVPKLVDNKVQFDGDIYSSDGTVTRRYGIVDLGSLSWVVQNLASSTRGFKASVTGIKTVSASNAMSNMISALYPIYTGDTVYAHSAISNGISMWSTDPYVVVYDSTKTSMSASDFKTAMSGVYLVYELATPTTESASPYVNPQICNEYGTEEYISAEQSGVTMIVGHNTKYPQNLRKKIEGLPWNFSSLIAPTEVTNKATRNYTVGSFLIMNNTLYKVTSAIANGGTITVGSNVSATTIMQEILAL